MHGIQPAPCFSKLFRFYLLLLTPAVLTAMPFAAPAFADEGPAAAERREARQEGLDQFGIRPAQTGEETVTGQTAGGQGLQGGVIMRDESGTYILPDGEKMSADEFHNKYPIFAGVILGPPPAASDGPTTYQGVPSLPYEKSEETKEFEREYDAWMTWSGSRQFGDDIGADRQPEFGHPGQPFGGDPIGSWIHYGPSRNLVSNDQVLLNALNANDVATFKTLFRGQFGGDPVEVAFGGESQSR